ncbi:MAG: phosphatidylserine decarboxylase [Methylothermaceae bacterium]|nr:phosphatidylserine decarboxylase [Methylothermaceae bacterium]
MPTFKQILFALIQYPLPHHLLSRLMGKLTHCRRYWLKNLLIRGFVRLYNVDMTEAASADPDDYACFNEFFIRALQPDVRPFPEDSKQVVSPADGTLSQVGSLTSEWLIQAKGKDYSVTALLGGDAELANPFENGEFATIYLSPSDYHRFHMPLDGTLKEMRHIPGRLFSVNESTAAAVDNLFGRNERVVCLFDTEAGPMAVVLVGALLVASIETVWHGVVTPPTTKEIRRWTYQEHPVHLERGAELGRFHMGSTVILLFEQNAVRWLDTQPGQSIRMGDSLAEPASIS